MSVGNGLALQGVPSRSDQDRHKSSNPFFALRQCWTFADFLLCATPTEGLSEEA
jgi:hypothetical protein